MREEGRKELQIAFILSILFIPVNFLSDEEYNFERRNYHEQTA